MTFPIMQTLLFSLMDLLQFYVLTNKLSHGAIRFRFMDVVWIILFTSAVSMSSYCIEAIFPLFVNLLLMFLLTHILYRRSLYQSLFLFVIGLLLMMSLQLSVVAILKMVIGKVEFSQAYALMAQSAALAVAAFVAWRVPIHILFRYVETRNKVFLVICLNIFLVLIFSAVCWNTRFEGTVRNMIGLSLLLVLILLINLIFFREGLKNRIVEEQNKAYEQYLPIVSELIDELRSRQHDVNNHLGALKAILEQQQKADRDIGRIEEYMEDLESSFGGMELIRIQNKIVAGFLYSKRKQADSMGISLKIEIDDGSVSTVMKDYEILEILSILVDNAFETGISDNAVRVRFFRAADCCGIEVANKHPYVQQSEIQAFFSKNYSTKASKGRGFGLHKLQQLLRTYNAEIQICNLNQGDNYLSFTVLLPS